MKEKLDKLMSIPWIAHVMRANTRYGNRLGAQFAAGITYFSVLALVPIAMLAFSAVGLALSSNPGLYDQVYNQLTQQLGSSVMNGTFGETIKSYMRNWGSIGIVGLLSALYAGAGWISNLKRAVRSQWRPEFEPEKDKHSFFMELLINLGLLVGLLAIGGLSLASSAVGTTMNGFILHTLHLDQVPGASVIAWLLSFLVAVIMGTILFLFIFAFMPHERAPRRDYMLGSVFAGVGLALLQSLAGVLIGMFAKNAAAAVFGPVIVLMLAFNLFAQLALFIAAWIATTNQPAIPRHYHKCDEPLRNKADVKAVENHWEDAEQDRIDQEKKKAKEEDEKAANKERSAWSQ